MDNYEIEQTLLGKLIVKPELIDKYSQLIHENLFEHDFNKSTFYAIMDLKSKNRTIDILTVSKLIKGENVVLNLSEMTERAFDFMEIPTCIGVLTEEFQKRTLSGIVHDVHNQLSNRDELELIVGNLTSEMSKLQIGKPEVLGNINSQIKNFLDDIEKRMNADGLLGIASGFQDIDKFTGGWQETDLIIVGGASSMGKTSFALALAYNAAKYTNTSTVIFSYEMSALQLLRRLASMESEISNRYITNGTLNNEELTKIHEAINNVEKIPLHIDEGNITSLGYLVHRIKEYVKNKEAKLVMIDYLQLVSSKNKSGNREQEVSKVARTLKNLAKELNITVIALSQLNRGVGMRNNSKPTLSDLRESGEIEQAADVVMLIYRPEYYGIEFNDDGKESKGTANIIFAKGRNIGVGEVTLSFKSEITKFIDYEKF
jgi:replicative DNA helicase